jgi:hypothetical protein
MKKSATRYFWDGANNAVYIYRPYAMIQNVRHWRDNTMNETSLTPEFWALFHREITYHQYIMWLGFEEVPATFMNTPQA